MLDFTAGSLRLGAARAESGYLVWNEGRPEEGGRQVLVRADVATGETIDITPAGNEWNVRTTVRAAETAMKSAEHKKMTPQHTLPLE